MLFFKMNEWQKYDVWHCFVSVPAKLLALIRLHNHGFATCPIGGHKNRYVVLASFKDVVGNRYEPDMLDGQPEFFHRFAFGAGFPAFAKIQFATRQSPSAM